MSAITSVITGVPRSANLQPIARITTRGGVGPIDVRITNVSALSNTPNAGVTGTSQLAFEMYESNNGAIKTGAITTAAYVDSTGVATITCNGHGLAVGDTVTIYNCSNTKYNGTRTVATVTTNTFTVVDGDIHSADIGSATVTGSFFCPGVRISGSSPVTVVGGGIDTVGILTAKRFIFIYGRATGLDKAGNAAAVGTARLELVSNGKPYFGQLEIDVLGKSGFGKDGDTTGGAAYATVGNWPE